MWWFEEKYGKTVTYDVRTTGSWRVCVVVVVVVVVPVISNKLNTPNSQDIKQMPSK